MALFQSNDVATKVINAFNGSVLRLDAYSVPDGNALLAANSSYLHGQVGTRFGHSVVFNDTTNTGSFTSMYNWFFVAPGSPAAQTSIILYYSLGQGILAWEQYPTPGFLSLWPPNTDTGAYGAVFLGTGLRLYMAFYNIGGTLGALSAQVYGYNVGIDNLFAAPIQNTIAAAETASGKVTAGVHQIGYVFTTRNGYTGKLCPVDSGGKFVPISFTSTGNHNLQLTISGALPTYLGSPATFQIVMSVVGQPNTYYAVPGAVGNCANPTVITINIDDQTLAQTGTNFTDYQLLLASSVSGTPPFLPNHIFTYSSRMGYVTIDSAGFPVTYFSEPNAFQFITADQHGIYLEGNAQAIAGFSLRGVAYIATQAALYSIEDSGDVPVKWTPPQKVDGSIGVLSPTCITVNPSLGYAGIAADRGFYIFQGGIFPALPLSYYQQPDWGRIAWMLPTQVQVVDDQLNKRFIVIAPLTCKVVAVNGSANNWIVTTDQNPNLYPHLASVFISSTPVNATAIQAGALTMIVTGPGTFLYPSTVAPTVGATVYPSTSTHQLTWDYTEGDTPETVKYSLDSMGSNFISGKAGFTPGAVAIVQKLPISLQEVWYAPSHGFGAGGAAFIRQNDGTEAQPYRDISLDATTATAINWIYQTNLIPNLDDQSMTLHYYSGMHVRAFGNAVLKIIAYGLDGVKSVVPARSPLPLDITPDQEYRVLWSLVSEQESIQFQTNVVDAYAVISLIRAYYSGAWAQR